MQGYYDNWDDYDDCGEDEADPFSCDSCGPWCPEWMGDGLCKIAIEQQAEEQEEYERLYVTESVPCPVCKAVLTRYEIPTDKLWTWPGDFYNPMIALQIFAVYDAPKGELHRSGDVCHIWVGEGDCRTECLVKLTGITIMEEELPF